MNINEIDLKTLRRPLEEALAGYEKIIPNLSFGDFADIYLTPDKSNSARTIIPVNYKGTKLADMCAIVFAKGDGTGDDKTFKLEDVTIPEYYRHDIKSERIIPRSKTGIRWEGFFPFFTLNEQERISKYLTHLKVLGVTRGQDKEIITIGQLGSVSEKEFDYRLNHNLVRDEKPAIYLTKYKKGTEKIGDPHAVYSPNWIAKNIQMGGFLSITTTDKVPF